VAIGGRVMLLVVYAIPLLHAAITIVTELRKARLRSKERATSVGTASPEDSRYQLQRSSSVREEQDVSCEQWTMLSCVLLSAVLFECTSAIHLYDIVAICDKVILAISDAVIEGMAWTLCLVALHLFAALWLELSVLTLRGHQMNDKGLATSKKFVLACMWLLVLVRATCTALELAVSSRFYYAFYAFVGFLELPLLAYIYLAASRKVTQLASTHTAAIGDRSSTTTQNFGAFRAAARSNVCLLVCIAVCACASLVASLHGVRRGNDGERASAYTALSWVFIVLGHSGVAYLLLKCSQATLTLIPAGTRRQRTERRRSTHTGTVNLGSGHWASCGRLLGLGLDTTEAGRAELPPGLRALQAAFTAAHKVTRVLKGLGGAGGGANCGEHVPSSPLDASRHGREAACGAAAGGCGQLHSEISHLEA